MQKISYGVPVLLYSPQKNSSFLLTLKEGAVFHSHLGVVSHDDIAAVGYGGVVKSSSDVPFFVVKPPIGEIIRRIPRKTQIMFPKEIGYLLLYLDVFPGAKVIECGTGSGGLTTALAYFVGDEGKVFSYEKRKKFSEMALLNLKKLKLEHRVEFKIKDIADGFDEKDVDAVFIDLPNPWDYVKHVYDALLVGRSVGFLIPTFNQIEKTIVALKEHGFVNIEVLEILLRKLKPNPGRIRPEDMMIGHTGYLVFAWKVKQIDDV